MAPHEQSLSPTAISEAHDQQNDVRRSCWALGTLPAFWMMERCSSPRCWRWACG